VTTCRIPTPTGAAVLTKTNGQAKHLCLALTELRAQQGRDHLAICLVVALSRLTGRAYVLISLHHHDQSLRDTLCQLGTLVTVTRHPIATHILKTRAGILEGFWPGSQLIGRISKACLPPPSPRHLRRSPRHPPAQLPRKPPLWTII
jgi:hypothetical protein